MIKSLLLQAGSGGAGNYTQFIMLAGMIAIFYFFFIRPQQKKQKDQKKFIEEIKKGDQVVTVGGIHGKVVAVEDTTLTLDVDRGSKLTIEKSSVSLDASKRLTE
ncbi:preprotein translocase subunit YajC [Marinoscillum furvescens]|uniref:Sec translocon accessory complex subunit YajC n=1 Tax=Marinoscillum furvescens DSM 4134 TaxID=1122208 RepID=A0A3D9L7Y0_MARFU|nr:preprotein translocase subunit YajC [Marinoscillum furvescens]REE00587.1 preprotein translocase subunit YajC [Marinoscillum furvescens DSM 4134]